jgi:acyl-CoA reductase-like NAD-dependent aldehyde dehydrogenase
MTQIAESVGGKNNEWAAAAGKVNWNIRPFVGGAYRASHGSAVVENINPATEVALCEFPTGDPRDIDEAVAVARGQYEAGGWSDLAPARRGEVLIRLADLVVEHKRELALMDCLEMGKPIAQAIADVEQTAPLLLRSSAVYADKLLGSSVPLASGSLSVNVFEPRGVVGAITPWNFPLVNAVTKLAPALAAGNCVVLKPSELSPSSALRIAELALEAGVPEGVINVVPGLGSTVGAALAAHTDVDMLSFTGSTLTGRKIMELAGRSNGKPMLMECGGKSAQVVFDDLNDLDVVAGVITEDLIRNQGQVCAQHSRLIVQESVKPALLERILKRAAAVQPGEPLAETTTFGPLASPAQRDRVRRYIDLGIAEGAEAALLGTVQESGGCYVTPTVFDRVSGNMSIAQEEIFGAVLCVMSFKTEAEAVDLANGTEFGLTSTVWTRDIGRGTRMAKAIRAGTVVIRSSELMLAYDVDLEIPCEPQKASGFGSEYGLRGLESYSTLKLVSLNGTERP